MAEVKTERLDGYRRLIDIARDLASTLDLDILLSRIVHAAAEISGAEAASILLFDDTSRQLYFQVATNMDESMRRGIVVPLDGSIAGWIVNIARLCASQTCTMIRVFFQVWKKQQGFPQNRSSAFPW
jgi:GAF domain-containing protein